MFAFSIQFIHQDEKKWCNNCHKQVETNSIKEMGTTKCDMLIFMGKVILLNHSRVFLWRETEELRGFVKD